MNHPNTLMAQLYAFSREIKARDGKAAGSLWALQAKPRSGITSHQKAGDF